MGPFKSGINRVFAKLILPRITTIYARGQKTYESLQRLNISNVELVTDYAFSMSITKPEATLAHELLKKRGYDKNKRNIGVFPSEVLRKKAEQHGQNYEAIIAEFIDTISVKDTTVYLVPHSQKTSDKRHNNDLPVCRDIYQLVKNKKHCTYLKEPTSPQQLRYISGSMDINVVARFHAMVSSLAMSTPVLVTGWSHKYQEVLDIFELSDCAFDVRDLSTKNLIRQFDTSYAGRLTTQELVKKNLNSVKENSREQADGIVLLARN